MTFVSVTRLRLRRPWVIVPFAPYAVRAFRQAQTAAGFKGGSVLRDHQFTFWTLTAWDGMDSMQARMLSGAHRASMPRFAGWCDQASVVHWEQAADALPDWTEAERRMRAEGRPSKVRRPAPGHADLGFRAARTSTSAPIEPLRR